MLIINSLFSLSIKVLPTARKERPKLKEMSLSSSMSKTIKLTRKKSLSTLTRIYSITLLGPFMERPSIRRVIEVGFDCPSPNFLKTENRIRLILALKSHKAFPN